MIALTALTLLVTVALLVCVLALMDQYRTLEVIRASLGVNDNPAPLRHPENPVPPSAAGLPADLDRWEHLVLLFLSTSCSTCVAVASALPGRDLSALHVVVKAPSPEEGAAWARDVGLPSDRVTLDVGNHVADAFALRTTPAVFVLGRGEIRSAQTVPSFRQLEPLLAGGVALPQADGLQKSS